MAKIIYEVFWTNSDNETVLEFSTMSAAQKYLKNHQRKHRQLFDPKLVIERWILIECTDYPEPEKNAGYYELDCNFDIWECTEQSRFENDPWAGNGVLIEEDEKYQIWRSDNFKYTGETGFFLVDINARRK